MSGQLRVLTDLVAADGAVSAEEALRLRREVFPDGVVSRAEAEALCDLAARVKESDPAWAHAFVEAISDHVLGAGVHQGHVDEAAATWLTGALARCKGAVALEAMLKVLQRCESAPEMLGEHARATLAEALKGAPIGARETELIRNCLYALGGDGAIAVTESEVRWLFQIDAESDGRANAPAWTDLFVKATLNHLMGRVAYPSHARDKLLAREAWLGAQHKPGAAALAMFDGGFAGFVKKLRQGDVGARMDAYYEAQNAAAEAAGELTLAEVAWAVGLARADGKRTANETALIAELKRLHAESKRAPALV